jgi:hypothetical protein
MANCEIAGFCVAGFWANIVGLIVVFWIERIVMRNYWILYDEWCRRLSEVPTWKIENARLLYDDWSCAAIECEEAHIPGDCPLCGAE